MSRARENEQMKKIERERGAEGWRQGGRGGGGGRLCAAKRARNEDSVKRELGRRRGGGLRQSEMEVWKEWVFISATPLTPTSFPPVSLCSSCLQDV